jgi:hypothetical protein
MLAMPPSGGQTSLKGPHTGEAVGAGGEEHAARRAKRDE